MATAKKPPVGNAAAPKSAAATKPAAPATSPAVKTKAATVVAATPTTATVAVAETAAEVKAKRVKLVRDGFTIPKDEYLVLESLKMRAAGLASPAKKSELLRAGIKALAAMPDKTLLAALGAVPSVKTGRPGKA